MLGLGEHVQRDDRLQPIPSIGAENLQVSGQRGGVTRDVKNLTRSGPAQHFQTRRATTDTRGVEQHGRLGRVPFG